jgi:hypothetical protein
MRIDPLGIALKDSRISVLPCRQSCRRCVPGIIAKLPSPIAASNCIIIIIYNRLYPQSRKGWAVIKRLRCPNQASETQANRTGIKPNRTGLRAFSPRLHTTKADLGGGKIILTGA